MTQIKTSSSGIRSSFRRWSTTACSLMIGALVLTSCAASAVTLEPATASRLQAAVLEVTTSAANGEFSAAQIQLAMVQAHLSAASAADQLSSARAEEIQQALDLVSADLATAVAASLPAPTPSAASVADDDDDADTDESGNSSNNGNNDKSNCKKKDDCD